ncbi:hypothetical protein JOF56_010833 [Kibdelosporangium banguiense]|uniref:Secreted protein n=1 Tax=Kibdelosporangium banguiense TaxID=1365924 RepID=A0ABS4U1C2_9PSEU|nr:hypothetical protein [Kibdelosporangium banguiense]
MSPYAFGVLVSSLLAVELERFLPGQTGLPAVTESEVGMGEVVEGVGGLEGVSQVAEQDEGLRVVVDGAVVVAGPVVDPAETVQCGCCAFGVVMVALQGECGLTVGTCSRVIADPGGIPTDRGRACPG